MEAIQSAIYPLEACGFARGDDDIWRRSDGAVAVQHRNVQIIRIKPEPRRIPPVYGK